MAKDAAWLNGGSPTEGFLMFGVPAHNPFKDIFNSMAGQPSGDWLFMLGLLGIGLALFTGIGMRIAAGAGALLYMLMYAASLPLDNNPVVDDHLIGAIVVVVLALTLAGDTWGFGRQWARTNLVRGTRRCGDRNTGPDGRGVGTVPLPDRRCRGRLGGQPERACVGRHRGGRGRRRPPLGRRRGRDPADPRFPVRLNHAHAKKLLDELAASVTGVVPAEQVGTELVEGDATTALLEPPRPRPDARGRQARPAA